MASSTMIAGLSLSVSSYLTPAGSLRNLLAAGAVSGFTVAIFTVLFILPLNNGLIAISRANSGKPMEEKQQQYVLAQLDQWRALHRVRMALGIISWLASTTALLASDPIIQFVFFSAAQPQLISCLGSSWDTFLPSCTYFL
jgi:hypothetical protein